MSDIPLKPEDLPTSWAFTNLGAVVDYGRTTKVEPSQIADDDWVLELEDIEKDSSRLLQRITFAQRQSKSTKSRFQVGNVLYGKLRPYLNKVVIADRTGYCTTEIVPIEAGSQLDHRYLFYWLKHPAFLKYVEAESHGLNMPRLGTDAAKAAPFVLAPRNEQTRIADQLDKLLARIHACNNRLDAIPALLKQFRQAVLAAATSGKLTEDWRAEQVARMQPQAESGNCVSDSGQMNYQVTPTPDSATLHPGYAGLPDRSTARNEVIRRLDGRRRAAPTTRKFKEPVKPDMTHWKATTPDSWSVESISSYAECLDFMRVPVTKNKRASTHGLYPYYGANGQVDLVDDFIFDDELVLVTEDETFYGREKPIAYRVSGRCWVNNHAHVLLAGNASRADYLCFALMYYNVLPWLTGTTGRAKLTQGVLNSLPIAVPPQLEIEEIVRRVEALFKLADRIEARYTAARTQAQRLPPLLLAKAFRGELVPQDPDDEPASVLLERIRATRQSGSAKPRRGRKAAKG